LKKVADLKVYGNRKLLKAYALRKSSEPGIKAFWLKTPRAIFKTLIAIEVMGV